MPVTARYGSWRSPISAELIAGHTVAFGGLVVDGDDLYWSESRPREGGRHTVMRRRHGVIEECLPAPFSARSRVHEYGGGAFTVSGGVLYFSNHADNRLYRQRAGELPKPITPSGPRHYADLLFDATRRRLLAVCEQHGGDKEPLNTLVAIDDDGEAGMVTLAVGHDFHATPALSPDGRRLAWLAWNHPNMPWDGCELWTAGFGSDGRLHDAQRVAGGESESIFQPQFSPDGVLYFVSDRSGWWNLYRRDGQSTEAVWPRAAEFGMPQWIFGMSTYAFASDQGMVAAFYERGRWKLARIDTRRSNANEIEIPDTDIGGLRALVDGVAYIGASPFEPPAIVKLDPASNRREVWRGSAENNIDPGYLSAPESLEYKTADGENANAPDLSEGRTSEASRASVSARGPADAQDAQMPRRPRMAESGLDPIGETANRPSLARGPRLDPIGEIAHAFFYPPCNRDYVAPAGELPPLLVMSHGGPTAATSSALNLKIQYWTSRGFAVLDVNYRGSTGFGRAYRERLNGRWGVADVEDCVEGARFLVQQCRVDEHRLAIRGSSAGGFTTLSALVFHDMFRAAAVYYGVSDLERLVQDTHKFEAHYLDRLVGPYPEWRERYRERSPIHHVERITCPVIFFQGLDDKVVPPDQTERMVSALRKKKLPVAYVPFEGESHGFRRAENIARALEAELGFYARIFGFEPGEALPPVTIENLD
jgi:dipeptidyl aminopeptidase/acylaminoacyl peptidase